LHTQRHEDRGIGVGEADDLESRSREQAVQRIAAIAPDFVAEGRVIAAKRLHGCRIDDREASGLDQTKHLADRRVFDRFLQ
jgi:hypothetical protein